MLYVHMFRLDFFTGNSSLKCLNLTLCLQSLQQPGIYFAQQIDRFQFGRSAWTLTWGPLGLKGSRLRPDFLVRVWRATTSASYCHNHGWDLFVGQKEPFFPLQNIKASVLQMPSQNISKKKKNSLRHVIYVN